MEYILDWTEYEYNPLYEMKEATSFSKTFSTWKMANQEKSVLMSKGVLEKDIRIISK